MNDSWRALNLTAVGLQDYLLSSDILFPSKCDLRPIEDYMTIDGSMNIAMNRDKFDLFDYHERPIRDDSQAERLRVIGRVLFAFIINNTFPIAGIFYHGFSNLKLRISHYRQQATITPENLATLDAKINAHSFAFFFSISLARPLFIATAALALRTPFTAWSLSLFGPNIAHRIATNLYLYQTAWAILNYVIPQALKASWAANANSLSKFLLYGDSDLTCMKSFLLKQEFGVVGQNRAILHPNLSVDAIDTEEKIEAWVEIFALNYFQKQELFLIEIQSIANDLPQGCEIPFKYPPKSSDIVSFLREGKHFSEDKINQIQKTLEHYENYYKKINNYLNDLISFNGNLGFLEEEVCKPYFSRSQETRREFDNYQKQINEIFIGLQTENKNLHPEYVSLREHVRVILTRMKPAEEPIDPFNPLKIESFESLIPMAIEILELNEGFDLRAIQKAKIKKQYYTHSDKTLDYPNIIREEAERLHNLLNLCEEIAKSTLPS